MHLHEQEDGEQAQRLQAAPRRGEGAPLEVVPGVGRELQQRALSLRAQRRVLAQPCPVVVLRPRPVHRLRGSSSHCHRYTVMTDHHDQCHCMLAQPRPVAVYTSAQFTVCTARSQRHRDVALTSP